MIKIFGFRILREKQYQFFTYEGECGEIYRNNSNNLYMALKEQQAHVANRDILLTTARRVIKEYRQNNNKLHEEIKRLTKLSEEIVKE